MKKADKEMLQLLYRAMAAIENPSDLSEEELGHVVEDLSIETEKLEAEDTGGFSIIDLIEAAGIEHVMVQPMNESFKNLSDDTIEFHTDPALCQKLMVDLFNENPHRERLFMLRIPADRMPEL